MKRTLPWIISASLFIALIVNIAWTNKRASRIPAPHDDRYIQFVTWVSKCEQPWWSKEKLMDLYLKGEKEQGPTPELYNCTVYGSHDRGNKLLAYKKADSAWVVLDPEGAVDYLASLLWKKNGPDK